MNINASTCAISGVIQPSGTRNREGIVHNVVVSSILGSQNLTIYVNPYKVIYATNNYQINAGSTINILPMISGIFNQPALCSASNLPPGLMINTSSCAITGVVPTNIRPGHYRVTVNSGLSGDAIILNMQVVYPRVDYGRVSIDATSGEFVNLPASRVAFPPNQTATCSAKGLPPGLVIDAATCNISGRLPARLDAGLNRYYVKVIHGLTPVITELTFNIRNPLDYGDHHMNLAFGQSVNLLPSMGSSSQANPQPCQWAGRLPDGLFVDPASCAVFGAVKGTTAYTTTLYVLRGTASLVTQIGFSIGAKSIAFPSSDIFADGLAEQRIFPKLVNFSPIESAQCSLAPGYVLPQGMFLDSHSCAISIARLAPIADGTYTAAISSPHQRLIQYVRIHYASPSVRYSNDWPRLFTGNLVHLVPQISTVSSTESVNCKGYLPAGLYIDPKTCAISGRISAEGIYPIQIMYGANKVKELQLNVTNPSMFFLSATLQVYLGNSTNISPMLMGMPSGPCTATGLPAGLSVNASCMISGVPSGSPGLHQVRLVAGSATASVNMLVLQRQVHFSTAQIIVQNNMAWLTSPTVMGIPSGTNLMCSAGGLPPGLTINPTTCVISGVVSAPLLAQEQLYSAVIKIGFTNSLSQILYRVRPATISYPTTSYNFVSGQAVNIVPKIVGVPAGMSPSCATVDLPAGLSVNASTCAITGIAASTGRLVTVQISNRVGATIPPLTISVP